MTNEGFALARAARTLVGTPFRLHGREPGVALDCVGVVLAALEALGRRAPEMRRYALRNSDVTQLFDLAAPAGFRLRDRATEAPGDLVLLRPGPAQHHLAIDTGGARIVHAHAGLGRVVEGPRPAHWPIIHRWHLGPAEQEG